MKYGILLMVGIVLLGLLGVISFYYSCLLKRWYTYFFKAEVETSKKKKWLFRILGVLLSVCTINFFKITGVSLLYFLGISLIMELVNKGITLLSRKKQIKIWEWIYKSLMISFLGTAGILIYGYYNIHHIVKTEYTVYSSKVSKDYKIALITDVHYGTILGKEELKEVCDRISGEEADLVILGGDMVDESNTWEEAQELFQGLSKIKQKSGIFYVDGNHDRQKYSSTRAYTDEQYTQLIEENHIQYVSDGVVPVNEEILLVGRKDYSDKSRAGIEELLSGADKEKYMISADHQPVEYEESSQAGVDLLVSGHTHAGQLFPIGYAIKLLKTADLYYGNEQINQMQAVVSSGLCGWGYPVRTQEHCEYVLIHVRAFAQ